MCWRKIFFGLALFLVSLQPLDVYSEVSANCFAIRADLLYFVTGYDETYFVINGSGVDGVDSPTPKGKRINNPVGYNLGFRLEGLYSACAWNVDFRLRWTHIHGESHEQVSNNDPVPQLWPTEIIPNQINVLQPFAGTASSHIGVMYQKGEFLLDEKMCRWKCWCLSLREGIEWSYLRYNETVKYQESSGSHETIHFHGHSKGLGPQLGVIAWCHPGEAFRWFPRPLGFKLMTSGSLLAANTKSKVRSTDILGSSNKVTQSSFWRLLPEWHFSFGINYLCCLGCFKTSLECGYELTHYFRGVSKLIFDEGIAPGHSFNQFSDFDVHGIYFAWTLQY